jgi:hypothetical protein
MKRMIGMLTVLFCLAGTLFAQNRGHQGAGNREPPVTLTVSGTLELINGNIGLKEGDTTYYVFGLDRLIGFVEGLTEGAEVTLEGRAFPAPRSPNNRLLAVAKLSLNGKEYTGLGSSFPMDRFYPEPGSSDSRRGSFSRGGPSGPGPMPCHPGRQGSRFGDKRRW